MSDVVQHGRDPAARGGPPPAVRRTVVVVVGVLAAVVLSRSGLLSAGEEGDPPRPRPAEVAGPAVVARVGGDLVRLGHRGEAETLARLPDGLPPDADLVPVLSGTGRSTLVGADDGRLFRVTPEPGAQARQIGRAEAVVGASTAPGRVLVLRGGEVVEVETATGRLTQPAPFPGFDGSGGSGGWTPRGVLAVLGTRALLMSRPWPAGDGEELALAWAARRVEAGTNPPVQVLGRFGPLIGIADEWVLTAAGDCPLAGCRVRIVSVTRDDVLQRDVAPPPGWGFLVGPAFRRTDVSLVPVQHLGDPSVQSLARLVAGGESALVVNGSAGVDLGAGLVSALDGSVRLVTRFGGKPGQVRSWRPERGGQAVLASALRSVPTAARLVCVCG